MSDFVWQVNNATARVVTKKPQAPLVNGEAVLFTFVRGTSGPLLGSTLFIQFTSDLSL